MRPYHVVSFSNLPANHDVQRNGFPSVHAWFDLPRVVFSVNSMVNEDVLVGVVAINEIGFGPDFKPFSGPEHSVFSVTAQAENADLHLLTLSCGLPV